MNANLAFCMGMVVGSVATMVLWAYLFKHQPPVPKELKDEIENYNKMFE